MDGVGSEFISKEYTFDQITLVTIDCQPSTGSSGNYLVSIAVTTA